MIDFGSCGVDDRASDVVIARTLLHGESRDAFRAHLDIDPATWSRGRGWALRKALITLVGALETQPAAVAQPRRVTHQILTDHRHQP